MLKTAADVNAFLTSLTIAINNLKTGTQPPAPALPTDPGTVTVIQQIATLMGVADPTAAGATAATIDAFLTAVLNALNAAQGELPTDGNTTGLIQQVAAAANLPDPTV